MYCDENQVTDNLWWWDPAWIGEATCTRWLLNDDSKFALIIILKQVLQGDRFKEMMLEINRCFDIFDLNVNTIVLNKLLNKMGFPENYMDIIDIDGGLNE